MDVSVNVVCSILCLLCVDLGVLLHLAVNEHLDHGHVGQDLLPLEQVARKVLKEGKEVDDVGACVRLQECVKERQNFKYEPVCCLARQTGLKLIHRRYRVQKMPAPQTGNVIQYNRCQPHRLVTLSSTTVASPTDG